jgi:hypothetical protein
MKIEFTEVYACGGASSCALLEPLLPNMLLFDTSCTGTLSNTTTM